VDRERGSLCPCGSHPRAGVPIGDGPAPIIGVGQHGARLRPVRPPRSPKRRRLLGVTLAAIFASGLPIGLAPTTEAAAATAAATGTAPLTLVSQTPWVQQPGETFDLKLHVGTTSPPPSQLGLSVSVYPCLSSVSAFDQSVTSAAGPPGTPLDTTRSPLAVTGLPVTSDGAVDLSMRVSVGVTGTAPPGGFAIDLSTRTGQCADYPTGVYPVRVQLVDTSTGQAVGGFTTHLVYTGTPTDIQRLQVAVVLPIGTTLGPATDPTTLRLAAHPSSALTPLSPASVAAISGTVAAISESHPSVPVTLEASPQTVTELATTGHQSIVTQLAGLSATPSVHQFASSPFVPVSASGLVDAGLASELALQVARGSAALSPNFPRTASAAPAGAGSSPLGAWFSNDGVDAATLAQLQADGYGQVVVPAASVPNAPTNDSTAEPFPLSPSAGSSMTAVAADTDLASRFTGSPGDPVLGASQLVAELAQIYLEKPNDTTPRIVAVVAPNSWADDPAFVTTLLGALDGNPIVESVTTKDLFSTLPLSSCRSQCRTVAGGGGALPAAAIRTERQRVTGLATAAPSATAHGVTTQLGDLVLAGESEHLHTTQQSGVLRNAGAAVNAQLDQLQVSGDRTVTLTSQRGRVPVTIYSAAPYPVTGTLTLTSDKLTFPDGQSQTVRLSPSRYNVFNVNVETRDSGLFKVDIALTSPGGGLMLFSGQVDVRSTATSVVGVILSLGAVAVLVVWWLRTSRKRRNQRRRDEAGDGVVATGPT
jgi:hypothetical protein